MTLRQQSILETIIEEYIKSAEPVGSKRLDELFDFGIKPAMIRQEMAALEEEGYLASPHTSAGRVPTDKAYRFYISRKFNKPSSIPNRDQQKVKNVLSVSEDVNQLVRNVSRLAAELSREFSAAGLVGQDTIFTSGLSQLITEPELQNLESVTHFMRFLDELDKRFQNLWNEDGAGEINVFIGEENPIRELRDFTFITGHYELPRGEVGFLSLIGPRRMDYRRNMDLVRYISREIERIYE